MVKIMSLYLDYNATTPVDPQVLEEMIKVYTRHYGNADSRTHDFGEDCRSIVENSRKQVADLLGVKSNEVFFTAGSTESSNIAILGLADYAKLTGKNHIITTTIEHHAVLNTVKHMESLGFEVDYINPGRDGIIDANDVLEKVKENTLLVTVMHVNNETGMIQPVDIIGEKLADKNILFHVDATQSCGKLVEELRYLRYDMLSFSAHKFHGPQGIGALVLKRKRYRLPPVKNIMFGGQQEHGIRPGTTPVALVAGIGKACEIVRVEYKNQMKEYKTRKDLIIDILNESGVKYSINGDQNKCMPNTINVLFEGVSSEALMISTKQYCGISNGSACTSKDYSPSYVLKAMGLSDEEANSSVRLSWGYETDTDELRAAISELAKTAIDFQ